MSGTLICSDTATVTNNIAIDYSSVDLANQTYTGNDSASKSGGMAVKVQASPDTKAVLTNSKTVSVTLNTPNATNNNSGSNLGVYGIKGRDTFGIEEWVFTNTGSVSAKHNGIGEVAAIALQDDAEAWTIHNSGSLVVERGALTIGAIAASNGAITATSGALAAGTLRVSGAIYHNEEEVRDMNIENAEGGRIEAKGQYTAGIMGRANSLEIENEGTIQAFDPTGAAIVTWDGRLRKNYPNSEAPSNCPAPNVCTAHELGFGKTFIENAEEGKILGNVIVSSATGFQVMAALSSTNDVNALGGGAALERRDSFIENEGTIEGKLYFGQGSHTLVNSGEMTGDIVVDQRRNTDYTNSTLDAANTTLPAKVYVAGRTAAFDDDAGGDDDDDADGKTKIYESDAV